MSTNILPESHPSQHNLAINDPMAFQDSYRHVITCISHFTSRFTPGITTSHIYFAITAAASIADHHHDTDLVSCLASGFICLLAASISPGEPKISLEAIAIPLVTATPKYCYHAPILHAWLNIYMELDGHAWNRVLVATTGTLALYPLLTTYSIFPASKALATFLIFCRPLQFLAVVSLILTYRSLWKPAVAHGALPEGINGIWAALVLHAVCVISPVLEVQWFAYTLYFQWFCGPEPPGPWVLMSGAESVKIEGLLTGTAAWAFGYHLTTAHTVYLIVNVIIHPLRQRLTGTTGKLMTTILMAQFWGLVWFLGVHALLILMKERIALASEIVLGSTPRNYFLWQSILIDVSGVVFKAFLQVFKPWYQNLRQPKNNINDPSLEPQPEPFKHNKITTPNAIRILRILPSLNNKTPIHCEMLQGKFTPTDAYTVYTGPKYIGISYCWDQPSSKPLTIHINSHPHQVQPTVHAILRTMRNPLSPAHVWIDSICINQSDDLEKASQVQLMRLIYENADYVAGWLRGPSNPDPGGRIETSWKDLQDFWTPRGSNSTEYRAREMLGRINSTMYIQQDFDLTSGSSTLWNTDARRDSSGLLQSLPGSMEDWDALQALITNPYFTRVWIIQEVVAARRVVLHYGGQIIPWELFARAMTILSSQGLWWRVMVYYRHNGFRSLRPVELPGIYNGLVLENLRRWYKRPGILTSPPVGCTEGMLSLEDTLKLCGRFEATWDVDRVFALLGVACDSDMLKIKVDYGEGKARGVFVDLARRLMARHLVMKKDGDAKGVFSVLRFAGVGLRDGSKSDEADIKGKRKGVEGLPSWVPDWTHRMEAALLSPARHEDNYRASGRKKCSRENFKFVQHDRLMLKAVVGPRIKWVSPVFTGYPKRQESRQFLNTFLTVVLHLGLGKGLKYQYTPANAGSEPQSLMDAYWRTLEGGFSSHACANEVTPVWGQVIMEVEMATFWNPNQEQEVEEGLLHDLFKDTSNKEIEEDKEDKVDPRLWRICLQITDNPDNIFSHMLMTDLSSANPNHKGGFTDILGTKKLQVSPLELPSFALGRRFCLTSDGHMGLVPAGTVAGDRIVIFEGAPTPHVVRPTGGKFKGKDGKTRLSSSCELVGESYIHGMMYGEGVKDDADFQRVLLV